MADIAGRRGKGGAIGAVVARDRRAVLHLLAADPNGGVSLNTGEGIFRRRRAHWAGFVCSSRIVARTRAGELLMGGLIAFFVLRHVGNRVPQQAVAPMAVIGLLIVGVLVFYVVGRAGVSGSAGDSANTRYRVVNFRPTLQ